MIKRSTLIGAVFLSSGIVGLMSLAQGCSSSSSPAGDTPDTGGTGADAGGAGTLPPPRPTAGTGSGTKWFAVNGLKLGLTKKGTTTADSNAWKDYGYDLDKRNTTLDISKASTGAAGTDPGVSCHRIVGSPSGTLVDGNNGIDNNFGGHVMQTIKSLKSDAEDAVTKTITDGKFTLILRVDNWSDSGDVQSAPGKLYIANEFNDGKSAPTFTAADIWKVNAASLTDGKDLTKPKLSFDKAYISGGYWVSGDFGTETINLSINLSGADISLPIDSGIITVKQNGDDGTIAGAMNNKKLQDALTPVAKKFGICPGNATYDQVVTTLTQSADLVSGAPNLQDPKVECNAISIAIGFTMKPTGEPKEIYTAPPPTGTDDCSGETGPADTGTGDTGAGG